MNDKILTSNFKDYVAVAADRGHRSMQSATYYVEFFLLQRFDVPDPRLSVIFPFIVYKGCKENNKEMKFNDSHTFSSELVCLTPVRLLITTF